MMTVASTEQITFEGPATYQIRVRGRIKTTWSERLEGMTISEARARGWIVTTLAGTLIDQAALAGVLNTLYELHLPVLEVKCLSAE